MTDAVVRGGVADWPQQREGALLAVHAVLTRRECHVPPGFAPRLPNREADQLQALERTVAEV